MYYVIEFQTNGESGACIPLAYTNRGDAESKYYQVLFAAVSSSVPKHGVALMDEDMVLIKSDLAYREPEPEHEPEPEPEPEPEDEPEEE